MLRLAVTTAALIIPVVAGAQDAVRTWKSGSTICGVRIVGGEERRFVAISYGDRLSYDFAPSDAKWRFERCDRPNDPPPSFDSIIRRIEEQEEHRPSCDEVKANWRKMSPRLRAESTELMLKHGGRTDCGLPTDLN